MTKLSEYGARLDKCTNPLLRKLFKIIIEKKTNICIAADGMKIDKVSRLIEKVGPHICILKIHREQLGDDVPHRDLMQILYNYKKQYNFLLFEDCKFSDGCDTVQRNYEAFFAKYVDIVTVLPEFGDSIFSAIERGAANTDIDLTAEPRGCLAVCEVSFSGTCLPDGQKLLEIAERNSGVCIGIIAQKLQVNDKNNMIKASPGVNLSNKTDGRNQQWRDPEEVLKDGADILIVGRGITQAPEDQWESLTMKYKEFCF